MNEVLAGSPAHELSAAIKAREVSCVEVVQAHLDRIDEEQPTYRPLISQRDRREVMAEARERDDELVRGDYRGWMHGLPHAVKDLVDVRGLPTTFGFHPLDEAPVASDDELFVSRLRRAGAIFIGKTNSPEFGLGSNTYNQIAGPTVNAFDPTRSAGGSSGGAAVAVARGMVPVADGSDFMGSLRNPPGWNGVLGLRPTFGRVPSIEDDMFSVGGGVDGPIARDARDLAQLLVTMSGHDPRAPLSLTDDPALLVSELEDAPSDLRIGWLADLDGYLPMAAGVLATCEVELARYASLGWSVERAELPRADGFESIDQLWPAWVTFRASQVAPWLLTFYDDAAMGARMKPEARWEVETYRDLTIADLDAARRVRMGLFAALRALFEDFDALVLPTAQVFPFDVECSWPTEIAGRVMGTYHRWMEVTAPATLAGLPGLAMPAGVGPAGLPMGLQVLAPHRAEALLLRVARAVEQLPP